MIIATHEINGFVVGINPYTSHNIMEYDAPTQVTSVLPGIIRSIDFKVVYNNVLQVIKNYKHTKILRESSENAKALVTKPIVLLHIDGNHDTKFVKIDIDLYVPKVRQGGYIIMDDIVWKRK